MDADELGTGISRAGEWSSSVTSPYTMEVRPRSPDRVFLARAFAHFCTLHRGLPDDEIERAFSVADEPSTVSFVRMATELLGDLLATGAIRGFARPFGGGPADPLPSSAWEIDDPWPRFASCAIDPSRPFEAGVAATHWIFVDLNDWNDVVEASVSDERAGSARPSRARAATTEPAAVPARTPPADNLGSIEDRLLRLPELERRTGLSKSTIYRRIAAGRFPATVRMSAGVALWRESEVAAWIADPC